MEMFWIFRNMTKYYKNFLAVDKVNLGVQKGECFGKCEKEMEYSCFKQIPCGEFSF